VSRIRVGLIITADAILCVVVVLIFLIDRLVNDTLYDFGLKFSDAWAQPYWLMLRTCLILLVIVILMVSVVELPTPMFQEKTEESSGENLDST
jgi:hypothetical protein